MADDTAMHVHVLRVRDHRIRCADPVILAAQPQKGEVMETDFNRERIVAIVRLLVMLASAVAGGFGLTVDPDGLGTVVACGVACIAGVYSWWKNANVTQAAQEAQRYLDGIKGGDR